MDLVAKCFIVFTIIDIFLGGLCTHPGANSSFSVTTQCNRSSEIRRRIIRRVLGRKGFQLCAQACHCIFQTAHPTLQIVYVSLLSCCVWIFYAHAMPLLKISIYRWMFPVMAIFLYGAFIAASFVDPGRITSQNVEAVTSNYEFDYILFHPDRTCETCHFIKPARSKHCSLCKACIARCDHHCAWVNNCIGQKNHRFFLLFLFSIVAGCVYGSLSIGSIFLQLRLDRQLDRAYYLNPETGKQEQLSLFKCMMFLIQTETVLGALGMFSVLVGLVVGAFLLYQIWVVMHYGSTTNELFKWEDVLDMVSQGQVFRVDREGYEKLLLLNNDWAKDESTNTARVISPEELTNIYDYGPWGNLKDVLFPRTF